MMQPSANGIAALFQGNPAALQQRVQKEEQAKPGLPPDLKELMALQILTEKNDAAQRQAAMNQLNQAGGPNMPTVAQTLQERAKQALQARMMQAQQQAQMPQQPQPIPTAPPQDQPEVSPEMMQQLAAMQAQGKGGLDQLPSNVGENYAGGGIIAFAGPTGSQVPRPVGEEDPLSDEERARLERELEMRLIGEQARAEARQEAPARKEEPVSSESERDASGIKKALAFAGALPAAAADIATLPINLLRRYVRNPMDESPRASLTPVSDIRSEYLDMNKEPVPKAAPQVAPVKEAAPQPQGIEAIIAQRAADLERQAGRKMSPEARELFTQREMSKFMQQQGLTKPQAAPPTVPPAGPQAGSTGGPSAPPAAPPRQAPVQQKPPVQVAPPQAPTGILTPQEALQVKKIMLGRMNLDPHERERMAREEAEKFIGAPDTSSLQTLADELAAKRQRLSKDLEANQGFDEYMRQIAMTPRGLTSAAAGAYGAEAQRNRGKALEAQDFETLNKMLETQVKISDIKRGWKKDLFTLGKAEFDKVYKDNFEAAKALGESDEKAKKLAQEAILAAEGHKRDLEKARIYTAPHLASNARTEQAIAAYKKANPKATEYEAIMAAQHPNAYLAPDKQQLAELKVLAENLRAMTDPLKNPDVESQKEAARQLGLVTATIARMSGVNLGGASTPPPGAVRLKQ